MFSIKLAMRSGITIANEVVLLNFWLLLELDQLLPATVKDG